MTDDGLDAIDAAIAHLREIQADDDASAEAVAAARLAELAMLRLLDTLLADAKAPPPMWTPVRSGRDGLAAMPPV